ncbi:MAG: hypothetical protein KZQ92_08845 [Candidatus Thiodiazotropha sp. (ex Lucinoma borealis)]|nr:hypothetical protein [Candidatus Thiodiazotropha sp. (ex Troendleina suluensis)]MCU7856894.1 hypothetical protein [Candidatus Thiodiazotropha sp. (ex Lucinoma borealis)]MCU7864069.1 hypothetical protein [Candidatus Thiodiazotropha sp. (ex Lucinoma borealis)]
MTNNKSTLLFSILLAILMGLAHAEQHTIKGPLAALSSEERLSLFSRINAEKNIKSRCQTISALGYLDKYWWVVRCADESLYPVNYANDGKSYTGLTCRFIRQSFGYNCNNALWFNVSD